jgi:serine/threonine-protein kinase
VAEVKFRRYRLIELLGRGGMGEVWRAHDTDTDRIVAIKVLPAHFSDNEEFQKRFRREAHAAAQLNSPHVVPIHHYGEIDGRLYVDMRLIMGRDLQTVLADGPLEPKRAARIIEGVALALHAAHEVGLVHRDVKPSNILLDHNDFAYLIDFGIARAIDETRMTKSGNMIGTFQYIAPERLGSGAVEDGRVDIYSLACVLYECLAGGPPFDGDTMAGLVVAHLSTPPPRPSIMQPDVPPGVDEVIATGMAKDPNDRYATTVELAHAAHDAITTPIRQPVLPPAQPSTDVVREASQPTQAAPTLQDDQLPRTLAATVEQQDDKIAEQPTQLASSQSAEASQAAPSPETEWLSERVFGRWEMWEVLLVAALVVIAAFVTVALVVHLVKLNHQKGGPVAAGVGDTVRLKSSNLVTEPGTDNPKAVVSFYEDFLCPACGNFERAFGPTVSKLVDIGAIAADYSTVSILDSAKNHNYSSRAGAASLCVADESIDSFRRFHSALYASGIQPSETGTMFHDSAQLIELASEAGAATTVQECINSGRYIANVTWEAAVAKINATPTFKSPRRQSPSVGATLAQQPRPKGRLGTALCGRPPVWTAPPRGYNQ